MGTSKSSPVRFIGQGPLAEFEYSQQPLPDNIRILLWVLDGAERRHHLARSWRAPDDLHVEVEGGEVMVTLPGTRYAVTYYKPANSRGGRSTVSDLAGGVRRESLEGRQREGKRAGVDRVKVQVQTSKPAAPASCAKH